MPIRSDVRLCCLRSDEPVSTLQRRVPTPFPLTPLRIQTPQPIDVVGSEHMALALENDDQLCDRQERLPKLY